MKYIESILNLIDNNNFVFSLLSLFLILYGSLLRTTLSPTLIKLFKNQFTQILICAIIMHRINYNFEFSVILAVAFVLTLNLITSYETNKKIEEMRNL